MTKIYVRRLVGDQTGVQVNLPEDRTDRVLDGAEAQTFGTLIHSTRGHFDRAFRVTPDKMNRTLGRPKSARLDARFKQYLNAYEAFTAGAASGIFVRLFSATAELKYLVANHNATAASVWTTSATKPVAGSGTWLLHVRVSDAIAEGCYAEISKSTDNTSFVVLRIYERNKDKAGVDNNEGLLLYELEGSLKEDELDEEGNSVFIGDLASRYYDDWIAVEVNTTGNAIAGTDAFNSATVGAGLDFFSDTGTMALADYTKAAQRLRDTNLQFGRMFVDSATVSMVSEMMKIASDINTRIDIAVPGDLDETAAITWKNQFNFGAMESMYFHWVLSPLKRMDPTGLAGSILFGTVGQRCGRWLARNANTNGYGIPPLNEPVAGKRHFINGTAIKQIRDFGNVAKAELAKNHINLAIYSEYHDGGGFVWDDSLAGTKRNGISKLETVCDMSVWIQDYFGRYAKSLTQIPMTKSIDLLDRESRKVLEVWLASSGWLVQSKSLDGKYAKWTIAPNERYPDDRIDAVYHVGFEGTTRKIVISQNMYSRD